ncbi:glutamate receptor ionotropic, kainate 2-like [Ostrinia nubilalis]|uniref:glutamate receptor ionotropic, kainate 2-like n=1 Tax=Ostrinia nubilalis TaxID=29057 RepID=UPI00308241D1
MWFLWLLLVFAIPKCTPQIIRTEHKDISYQIAGIFTSDAQTQMLAFNESMQGSGLDTLHLSPALVLPSSKDSLSVWNELCSNRNLRPIAVVGPQDPKWDGIVRDQCALANIPHIQATWQPLDPDLELNEEEEGEEESESEQEVSYKKLTINFYPDSDEISLAYAALLKYYNWQSFAVLYEDEYGLTRIQKILAEHTTHFPVVIRKLNVETHNRDVFKELSKYQLNRIMIDCDASRILDYMNQARDLKMVNYYQHYILVTMEAYIVAEQLTHFHSNITWISITEYDKLKDAQHALAPMVGKWITKQMTPPPPVTDFTTEALIMSDIANHLLKSLKTIKDEITYFRPRAHICDADAQPWRYGALFQNAILTTPSYGVTGNIAFDEKGRRFNYTLYVNEIHVSKMETIGTWSSTNVTEIQEDRPDVEGLGRQQSSKHFVVISTKAKPWFWDKDPCEGEACDDDDGLQYQGFSVDLIKEIFRLLREEKFNYTFEFMDGGDKKAGTIDETSKKWTGMIGDLLDNVADLAVCDITITEERKKVVDFSVPFMSLGISILFTQKKEAELELFSFLNPYTFEVWIYTATAYCVVSVILFISARISPADWENPQPCDKDPEELENIWNFKNCAWLTMGSIMTQGCDILPKAFGSRWVCSMWWFFAMIVCQTYIAQLSASMTSALEDEPINSVEDLFKQNKILYGAMQGGSTLEFFKTSKDKMFKKMYEKMMTNPVLVASNDEGVKRVVKGKNRYAFFMESTSIEYKLKRNCDLTKVGGELDSKDYGIAMPANSPFRSHINRAILRLKELTLIDEIKTRWWNERDGAMKCPEANDTDEVEGSLGMENLMGAFLVLIVGMVFCLFVTALEFLNEVRNIVVREQVSHKEVIIKELKWSLNFFQLQKPVLRNPSRAPSIASSTETEYRMEKQSALIENFLEFEKETQ